jgi:hypothetical protein
VPFRSTQRVGLLARERRKRIFHGDVRSFPGANRVAVRTSRSPTVAGPRRCLTGFPVMPSRAPIASIQFSERPLCPSRGRRSRETNSSARRAPRGCRHARAGRRPDSVARSRRGARCVHSRREEADRAAHEAAACEVPGSRHRTRHTRPSFRSGSCSSLQRDPRGRRRASASETDSRILCPRARKRECGSNRHEASSRLTSGSCRTEPGYTPGSRSPDPARSRTRRRCSPTRTPPRSTPPAHRRAR